MTLLKSKKSVQTMNKEKVIGEVSFSNGEVIRYTDKTEYLKTIQEELDYRYSSGFKYLTFSTDATLRKSIADLEYGLYGEKNPHSLEYYQQNINLTLTPDSIYELQSIPDATNVNLIIQPKYINTLQMLPDMVPDIIKNNGTYTFTFRNFTGEFALGCESQIWEPLDNCDRLTYGYNNHKLTFTNCDFKDNLFTKGTFNKCHFEHCHFELKTECTNIPFPFFDPSPVEIFNGFYECTLESCIFNHSSLTELKMTNTKLTDCMFTNIEFSTHYASAEFDKCNLENCRFHNSSMHGDLFFNSTITSSRFTEFNEVKIQNNVKTQQLQTTTRKEIVLKQKSSSAKKKKPTHSKTKLKLSNMMEQLVR